MSQVPPPVEPQEPKPPSVPGGFHDYSPSVFGVRSANSGAVVSLMSALAFYALVFVAAMAGSGLVLIYGLLFFLLALISGGLGLHRAGQVGGVGRSQSITGLTLCAVAVLATCVLLPELGKPRERGHRIRCSTNLRGIGLALMMYGDQYKAYPLTDSNGYSSPEMVYELLGTGGDMTPKVFICPSSDDPEPTGTTLARSSFGFSCTNILAKKTWRPRLSSDLIIAGDRRNGGEKQSKNHKQQGQNVLFGDGHAEFITNPYKHADSMDNQVTDDIFADESHSPDTFLQN